MALPAPKKLKTSVTFMAGGRTIVVSDSQPLELSGNSKQWADQIELAMTKQSAALAAIVAGRLRTL